MKLITRIKPPCSKCPYKQGSIHTVTNPCPKCKTNGYQAFERFQRERSGNSSVAKDHFVP